MEEKIYPLKAKDLPLLKAERNVAYVKLEKFLRKMKIKVDVKVENEKKCVTTTFLKIAQANVDLRDMLIWFSIIIKQLKSALTCPIF